MARSLSSSVQTELAAASNRPFFLAQLNFSGTTLRLSTLLGDVTWNSQTWYGNGWLQGIDAAAEQGDLESAGAKIILASVPSNILNLILAQCDQAGTASLWLGFLDSSGAIIADPYLIFKGYLDVPTLTEDAGEPSITLDLENVLADLERTKEGRYNKEHQHIYYPSDKGFDFVAAAADWTGYWGTKAKKPPKKKTAPKKTKRK